MLLLIYSTDYPHHLCLTQESLSLQSHLNSHQPQSNPSGSWSCYRAFMLLCCYLSFPTKEARQGQSEPSGVIVSVVKSFFNCFLPSPRKPVSFKTLWIKTPDVSSGFGDSEPTYPGLSVCWSVRWWRACWDCSRLSAWRERCQPWHEWLIFWHKKREN